MSLSRKEEAVTYTISRLPISFVSLQVLIIPNLNVFLGIVCEINRFSGETGTTDRTLIKTIDPEKGGDNSILSLSVSFLQSSAWGR